MSFGFNSPLFVPLKGVTLKGLKCNPVSNRMSCTEWLTFNNYDLDTHPLFTKYSKCANIKMRKIITTEGKDFE